MTHPPAKTAKRHRKPAWMTTTVLVVVVVVIAGCCGLLFRKFPRAPNTTIPQIVSTELDTPVRERLEELRVAVEESPRNPQVWGNLGMMLRANEFDREASVCLLEAARLDPAEPRWPYHAAHTLMSDDPTAALAQLRRAVSLSDGEIDQPRLWLGKLLVERGQLGEAESMVDPLLKRQPAHPGARLLKAQIEFARQQWDASSRALEVCLTNRYTIRQAHALLGQIQLRLGHADNAARAGKIVQSLPADEPWPDPYEDELLPFRVSRRHLIEFIPVLLARQSFTEAAQLTERLLADFPDAAEGWLFQGRLKYLEQDWPAAERALLRHLEMEPDSVDGLMQFGQLRLRQKQPEDAITQFSRVVALKPDSHIAHYQLGEAQWQSGDTNAAIRAWHRTVEREPAFLESYLRLAIAYYQTGKREEALEQMNEAMRINPADMRVQEALEFLQSQ